MAVTVDEKTQNLLNRLRNGEEVSQFTEIEKSNMVFAWKSHVFSEVLPPWVLGITLFLFLVLAGGLGFLLTIVLCAVFFFGFAFAGDWLFDRIAGRFSFDDLLKPTRNWAIKRAAAANKEETKSIPYFWIAVGVFLLVAVFTVPDKASHEAEVRIAVSEEIAHYQGDSLGDAAAKWIVSAVNQNLQDDPNFSYIDSLGYQYKKLLILSTVRTRPEDNEPGELVSIGFLNQVYVFSE